MTPLLGVIISIANGFQVKIQKSGFLLTILRLTIFKKSKAIKIFKISATDCGDGGKKVTFVS